MTQQPPGGPPAPDEPAAADEPEFGGGSAAEGASPGAPEPAASGGAVHVGQRPAKVVPFRDREGGGRVDVAEVLAGLRAKQEQAAVFPDAAAGGVGVGVEPGADGSGAEGSGADGSGTDGSGTDGSGVAGSRDGVDWAWVEEWRAGREPVPWAQGLAVAAFTALLVGSAVWVLSAGLIDRPVLAIAVNVVVAGGLTPAMWLSRDIPVLRWIAAGGAVGLVGGWIAAIMLLSIG